MDISEIITLVQKYHPDLSVQRLKVKHPDVDDDGIWFFHRGDKSLEIQLESSSGNCPFGIETNKGNDRYVAKSINDAVNYILMAYKSW